MSGVHHHLSIFKDARTGAMLVNLFAQKNFVKNMVYINARSIPFVVMMIMTRMVIVLTRAICVLTEQHMKLIAENFQLDLIITNVIQNDTKSTT